jgi:hypothetical protein
VVNRGSETLGGEFKFVIRYMTIYSIISQELGEPYNGSHIRGLYGFTRVLIISSISAILKVVRLCCSLMLSPKLFHSFAKA